MNVKFKVILGIIVTYVCVAFIPGSIYAADVKSNGRVKVSFYGGGGPNECGPNRTCHGSKTACGQTFDMHKVSVAHESLPCGTKVQFCHQGNCLIAKVNDSGNFEKLGRQYDLSRKAAEKLGIINVGTAFVEAKVISIGM